MRDASADGEQGEAGAGSSPTLSQAEDAGASGPAQQGAPQRRTTEAGPQRAVSNSEAQGSGRGAKPSCGLVHLNKAFIELHFAGQGLPQTVWVQVNVDGRDFSVRLPGQVYSTSCGQDHWLLGLQYVFKVHKDPLISRVEMGPDCTLRVTITSRGRQDKFASPNSSQADELLRALEVAAVKAAETAVMKRQGRVQVTGPNINVPKKQLRAQWPALLTACAPTEVTAHIWLDDSDSYISCPAKIILTKAKAEPVFYLAGLSSLLKNYTGAYASLELVAEQQLVRVHLDTNTKHLQAALGGAAGASSIGVPAAAAAAAGPAGASAPAAAAAGGGASGVGSGVDEPAAVAGAARWDAGAPAPQPGVQHHLQQQRQGVAAAAKPTVHAGVPITGGAAGTGAVTPPLPPAPGGMALSGGPTRPDMAPAGTSSAHAQLPVPAHDRHQQPQQQHHHQQHQHQRAAAHAGAGGLTGGLPHGPAPVSWPIAAATAAGAAPPAAAGAWRAPPGYAAADVGMAASAGGQLGWSRKRPYAAEALYHGASAMDWCGSDHQHLQQQQMVVSPRFSTQRMIPPGTAAAAMGGVGLGPGHATSGFSTGQVSLDMPAEMAPSMVPPSAHVHPMPGQHMMSLVAEGYSGQGWPQQVYGGPPAYASHAAAMEEALEHQALHYQHQQWQSAYEVEARRRSGVAGVMYDSHHYPQHHTVQQYPYAHYDQQQPYGTAGYDSSHLQVPTASAAAAAAAAAGAGQGFAAAAGTAGALHASTPHWPKADQSGGGLMDKQGGAPSSSSRGKAAATAAAAGNAVKAERGAALAALPLSTTGLASAAGRAQAAGRDKPAGAGAAHHLVTIPSSAALAAAAALVPMSAEAAAQLSYHHRGLSQDGLNLLATHALLELANDGAPPGAAAAAHTGAGGGALGGDGVGPVLKKRRLQRSRITCPSKLRQQLLLLTVGVADAAAEGAAGGAGGSLRDVDMVPVGGTPNLGTSPPAAAGGAAAAAGGGSCVGAGMRLPRVSSPDEVTTGFHLVGTGAPAAADTPTAGGTSARRLSDKDTQQWRDQHQPHLQQRQQDKLPAVAGGKAAAGSTPPTPDSHVHFPLSPMASGSGRRTSTTSSAAAAAAAAAVAAVDVSNDAAGMQHRMAPQSELARGQLGHQSHLASAAGGALVRDTPQSSDTGSTVDDPNMLVAAAGADGDTRAAAAWAGAAAAAAAAAAAHGTSRASGEQEAVCSSRQGGVARQLLLPSVGEALQPQQEAYWRRRAAAAVAAASRRAAAAGGSTSQAGGTGPFDGVVHRLEKVSLQQPALPALFLPKRGCHSGDGRSPSHAAVGSAGRLEMASTYPPAAAAAGSGSGIRAGHAGGPLRGAGASAPLPTTRPTAAAAAAGSAGGGVYRRTRPTPLELPGTPPGWAAAPPGVPGMALPGAPRGGYGHPSEYTLMPPTPAANIAPWSGLEEDPYGAAGSWALASADPAAAAAALKQQINACLAAPPVVGRVSEERRRRYYEAAATAASIQNLCAARAQQRPALPPYPLQHSAVQVAAPGDDLVTLGNARGSRPYAASAAMGTYSPGAAMTAGVCGVSGSGAPYALNSSRALPWGPEQQRQVEYHDAGPWYASSEGGWAQQVSAHGAAAHLTRLPHPGAAAAAMAAAAAAGGAAHSLAAAVTLPMAGTGGGDVEMGSGLPNQASDRASTAVAGVPPLLEQKSSGPSSAAPGSCHMQGAAAGEGAGGMRAPHPGGSSWHGAGGRHAEAYPALPPPAWGEPGAGYGAPGAGYGAMYWEDPAAVAAASAWAAGVLSSASPKCPHARRRRMLLMQEARLLAASYSGHAASEPAHQQLGSYSGQQQPSNGNHTSPAWLEQPAPLATAAASSGGHARGMPPASGAGGGPASQAGPQQQLQQQGSVERPVPPGSSCSMGGPGVTSSRAMAMSPTLGAPAPAASPGTAAAAAAGGVMQDAGAGEVVGAVDESGWPLLPDAANLVEVGRALVTVMNFLNAPSSDRLALTRTLRSMTPPDREWLLSFTYPYLQDACARRALPELQLIIRDILSGAHAATAAAEAAAAGGGTAAAGAAPM